MAIIRISSPIGAPTTATVVAAPYCPIGTVLIGTSRTPLVIDHDVDRTFIVKEFNAAFQVGARMRASAVDDPANQWMEGVVTHWESDTSELTLSVDLSSGGGSADDWTLNVTGLRGPTGARGETGATGEPGPSLAEKGDRGETGPTGPDGATGPRGEAGEDGAPATISVDPNTITSLTAHQASVVNLGTAGDAILQFTIPEGGPKGPQGAIGTMGDPGTLGSVALPLEVTGNDELKLRLASPFGLNAADELTLVGSHSWVPLDGSQSLTGVITGVAPPPAANDGTVPTTSWARTFINSDVVTALNMNPYARLIGDDFTGSVEFAGVLPANRPVVVSGVNDFPLWSNASIGTVPDVLFGTTQSASGRRQRLPSGIIIQWHRLVVATDAIGEGVVTFPNVFPNTCYLVIAMGNGHNNRVAAYRTTVTAHNFAFIANGFPGGNFNLSYIAFGS